MPEEAPVVQNWRLLIVALVLGLIVAVVYNIHMDQVRNTAKGDTVMLLQVKKDLRPGEKIKAEYIEKVPVLKSIAANLGNVMEGESYSYAIGKTVNTLVTKDKFLTFADVEQDIASRRPSIGLTPTFVAFEVPVDPRLAPGEILRVGDHMNLMGKFNLDGKVSYLTIMEGARAVGVGGHAAPDPSARVGSDQGFSSFKSVTIEVSPKVSKELANVLDNASGVRVVVRSTNPAEQFPDDPQINNEVKKLALSAAGGSPGAMPRPEN